MHLVTLYEAMITGHFFGIDKDDLIEAIGRHTTDEIAKCQAHTATLAKLSPEQKRQQLREQVDFLRQTEQELVQLLGRHTAWEAGVHDLLGEIRNDHFSAEEAVYLFIDG